MNRRTALISLGLASAAPIAASGTTVTKPKSGMSANAMAVMYAMVKLRSENCFPTGIDKIYWNLRPGGTDADVESTEVGVMCSTTDLPHPDFSQTKQRIKIVGKISILEAIRGCYEYMLVHGNGTNPVNSQSIRDYVEVDLVAIMIERTNG